MLLSFPIVASQLVLSSFPRRRLNEALMPPAVRGERYRRKARVCCSSSLAKRDREEVGEAGRGGVAGR